MIKEFKREVINKKFIIKIAKQYLKNAVRFEKRRDDLAKVTVVKFFDKENNLLGKLVRDFHSENVVLNIN